MTDHAALVGEVRELRRELVELRRSLRDEVRTQRLTIATETHSAVVEPGSVSITGPEGSTISLRVLDAEAEISLYSSDAPGGPRHGDAAIILVVQYASRSTPEHGTEQALAVIELAVDGTDGAIQDLDLRGQPQPYGNH